MELSELLAYAKETYHIEEQHRYEWPDATVLCHPDTGKAIALCMRLWDSETGELIERADLRCRESSLREFRVPYLSRPFRMHGYAWIGIQFTQDTSKRIVRLLLDRAISYDRPNTYTIELDSAPNVSGEAYQDTALPFSGRSYRPDKVEIPEKILQMRRMNYTLGDLVTSRNKSFHKQAVFMQDYEETDIPFEGNFQEYFPTYRSLSIPQLRGYFSWRTKIRKGIYEPVPISLVYIYLYELLNGAGTAGPEDQLRKLKQFTDQYEDPNAPNQYELFILKRNVNDWILALGILAGLPPAAIVPYVTDEFINRDRNLMILHNPQEYSDSELLDAIRYFSGKHLKKTPALQAEYAERGLALFTRLWRIGAAETYEEHRPLFQCCFGELESRRWYPLLNAVYDSEQTPDDTDYMLNPIHFFHCRSGRWTEECYDSSYEGIDRFKGLIHQADSRFRKYLKTGRYLKEKEADQWAVPLIESVILEDKKAVLEASRPKITIDLSGLDQIRRDALTTQNSLLTETDLPEAEPAAREPERDAGTAPDAEPAVPDLPIDAVHLEILRTLLQDGDVPSLIRAHHLMPAVIADTINEVFYDEIGDTIVVCEDDVLSLVEDYREDVEQIIGGSNR